METYNLNCNCMELNFDELLTIEGGSAYEAGRKIGKSIREFCDGFWDGLTGQ